MDWKDATPVPRRITLLRRLRRSLLQGQQLQMEIGSGCLLLSRFVRATSQPRLLAEPSQIHSLHPQLGQAARRLLAAHPPAFILKLAELPEEPAYAVFAHSLFRWLAWRVRGQLGVRLDEPDKAAAQGDGGVSLSQAPVAWRVEEPAKAAARIRLSELPAPLSLRVHGPTWTLLQAGDYDPATIQRWLTRRIWFVCTGNTCRSPLAELFCKQHLARRLGCGVEQLPEYGWIVASAGVAAEPGSPASPHAQAVARQQGLSLARHRSQPLQALADMGVGDLFVALTARHREALQGDWPELPVRLLHTAGLDIADPFGGSRETYAACAAQIEQQVRWLVEELLRSETPAEFSSSE